MCVIIIMYNIFLLKEVKFNVYFWLLFLAVVKFNEVYGENFYIFNLKIRNLGILMNLV